MCLGCCRFPGCTKQHFIRPTAETPPIRICCVVPFIISINFFFLFFVHLNVAAAA
jgi:hypothetical protein